MFLEPVPVTCARIDALRSHGYRVEALRLAVCLVRTLKHDQEVHHRQWINESEKLAGTYTSTGVRRNAMAFAHYPPQEGWVGHPLDPITCLFDTLSDAALPPEERGKQQNSIILGEYSFC